MTKIELLAEFDRVKAENEKLIKWILRIILAK